MDLLCVAFECDERGVFATAGVPWTVDEIARAAGGDLTHTLPCVQELIRKGVAKRNKAGAIFSARLVRDESIRKIRTEAGKKGGNPDLLKQNSTKGLTTGVKQNPTPSPSPSLSASSSKSKTKDSGRTESGPDSRIKILQDSFFEALKVRLGEPPARYNGGAAGAAFKTLLQKYPLEEIQARFKPWFESTDKFIVDNSFKVEMFFGSFNRLKDGPILKRSQANDQRKSAGYAEPITGKYKD